MMRQQAMHAAMPCATNHAINLANKLVLSFFRIQICFFAASQHNSRTIPNKRAFLHATFVSSTL